MKIIIVLLLIAIVGSLGSALYYLLHNPNAPQKMLKALTLRISLSLGLFVLLMIAFALGWITPHTL